MQDIQNATKMAYAMVTKMGMSDRLGNIDLASQYNRLSGPTKALIESEVRRFVEEGRERATALLTERRGELDIIAKALVEYEMLSLEEMQKLLKGEKLTKMTVLPTGALKLPEIVLPPGLGGGPPSGAAGAGVGAGGGASAARGDEDENEEEGAGGAGGAEL